MREPERRAVATPPSVREKLRELYRAADDRARVAEGLVEDHVASALALCREAALLYAAAAVTARTGDPVPEPLRADDVLDRFRALELSATDAVQRSDSEAFLAGLSSPDILSSDRLEGAGAAAAANEARRVMRSLASLVEPRTVAEIKVLRGLRIGVASLGAGALLVFIVAALLAPVNVALHKPVLISASHPESVSPPSGLTDGVKSGAYGAETTVSDAPWIEVDLLALYKVDTIKVYNRGDTAFDAGLPMTLQCSTNDREFVDIETRTASFSQTKPWVAKARGRVCRYVRVRGAKGRYVALTELEVYGRKK
jgi:hypothetical protein